MRWIGEVETQNNQDSQPRLATHKWEEGRNHRVLPKE